MIWRPVAVMRGPLRTKGHLLDLVAVLGFAVLAAMAWWMWLISPSGGNPFLFRGGFLLCAIGTLMMVAAVTHERAGTSRVLSIPVLLWVGTRSYGLYLYHWPIYQIIRGIAGVHLKFHEFVFAMIATVIVTEISYRFIETPIRKGTMGESWHRLSRSPSTGRPQCAARRRCRVRDVRRVRGSQPRDRRCRRERSATVARRCRPARHVTS